MSKNQNMLHILWMLNSGEKITAKQISEKLEINIRTVYRYIDALCASGVPIISEPGHNGGYSLLNSFIKSPLTFDLEEQKALFHAAIFAQETGYPFDEALSRATTKIRMYLNEEQTDKLDRHLIGFDVINKIYDSSLKVLLEKLEQAKVSEHSLTIEYHTSYEDSAKQREIDPYGIIYWNNKWYTIAYCHLRKKIRSFRVDRIKKIIITDSKFQRPDNFSPRKFFMEGLLYDTEGSGKFISVRIKGKPYAIDEISLHWFLGHDVVERTADEIFLTIDEKSVRTNVPYLLLPFGKDIQVIEPISLKAKLYEISIGLANYYQS